MSSMGRPMLPAMTAFKPLAFNRCAVKAVVVLLPFVPVMQMVRASGFSANQILLAVVNRVPALRAASSSGR